MVTVSALDAGFSVKRSGNSITAPSFGGSIWPSSIAISSICTTSVRGRVMRLSSGSYRHRTNPCRSAWQGWCRRRVCLCNRAI